MMILDPTAPPTLVPVKDIPPGDAFMLQGDPYLALDRKAFEGAVFLKPQRPGEPPDETRAVPLDATPAVDLTTGVWVTITSTFEVLHLRDALFAPSLATFWKSITEGRRP